MEIKRLQKQLGITTIFVTHDQEECFSISDKVAVMNNNVIEQYDTPENIYHRPKTEFVARFIGFENFIALKKTEQAHYVSAQGNRFNVTVPSEQHQCMATIRPEDIELVEQMRPTNVIEGTVGVRTFLGKSYQYEIITQEGKFLVNLLTEFQYQQGDKVYLYCPENKLILVESSSVAN
jgi:putative spermidine/putrescine transport system ATP-binding protein